METIPLDKIRPSRGNPRKEFDQDALAELTESVKLHGVIEPIIVRRKADHFEIVAGERRYLAAKGAGLEEIPVVVRETDDAHMLELQIVENLQRENLTAMDEAEAFRRMRDDLGLSVGEIARRVGKGKPYVFNSLKICDLTKNAKEMLEFSNVGKQVAMMIAYLPPDLQDVAAEELSQPEWDGRLGSERVREYINKLKADYNVPKKVGRPAATASDYKSNWLPTLLGFTPEQFVKLKAILRGRTDRETVAEAVDVVSLERHIKSA